MTAIEYLNQAQERYEVFHLVIEEGHYASRGIRKVLGAWKEIIGKKAIPVSNYKHISEVITSIIEVNEGVNYEDVVSQWQDSAVQATVKHALSLDKQAID